MGVQDKMKKGFTLIEIMIVVGVIGIVIAVAVPGFIKARRTSQARACQENLSKIHGAKEQWAIEELKTQGDSAPEPSQLADSGYLKKDPDCPSGGAYSSNNTGIDPTCTSTDKGHNLNDIGNPVSEWS